MAERLAVSKFEVNGQAIMAVVAAMSITQNRALKMLAAQGIAPLEKERWYPMDKFLVVFEAIGKEIGPNTIKAVGRKIPENAIFPPNIQAIEDGFRSVDMAYRMNHRGTGSIGGYRYSQVGPRTAQMLCDNPYPCSLDEGLLEALGERFRPVDSLWVRVEHQPGSCRKSGAASCTFNLSW
ncbi:hypothetical protein [Hyalangium versicolor]|uniref:hypothetical protein n=1 Tax=Hyalangium versicolor TaxID=2861190 RepID=UPI001CC8F5BE|nr:hypothetical protein [Hyalangium versicolor]